MDDSVYIKIKKDASLTELLSKLERLNLMSEDNLSHLVSSIEVDPFSYIQEIRFLKSELGLDEKEIVSMGSVGFTKGDRIQNLPRVSLNIDIGSNDLTLYYRGKPAGSYLLESEHVIEGSYLYRLLCNFPIGQERASFFKIYIEDQLKLGMKNAI